MYLVSKIRSKDIREDMGCPPRRLVTLCASSLQDTGSTTKACVSSLQDTGSTTKASVSFFFFSLSSPAPPTGLKTMSGLFPASWRRPCGAVRLSCSCSSARTTCRATRRSASAASTIRASRPTICQVHSTGREAPAHAARVSDYISKGDGLHPGVLRGRPSTSLRP